MGKAPVPTISEPETQLPSINYITYPTTVDLMSWKLSSSRGKDFEAPSQRSSVQGEGPKDRVEEKEGKEEGITAPMYQPLVPHDRQEQQPREGGLTSGHVGAISEEYGESEDDQAALNRPQTRQACEKWSYSIISPLRSYGSSPRPLLPTASPQYSEMGEDVQAKSQHGEMSRLRDDADDARAGRDAQTSHWDSEEKQQQHSDCHIHSRREDIWIGALSKEDMKLRHHREERGRVYDYLFLRNASPSIPGIDDYQQPTLCLAELLENLKWNRRELVFKEQGKMTRIPSIFIDILVSKKKGGDHSAIENISALLVW